MTEPMLITVEGQSRVAEAISMHESTVSRVTANKSELMEKAGGAILKAIRDYNAVHPRQK